MDDASAISKSCSGCHQKLLVLSMTVFSTSQATPIIRSARAQKNSDLTRSEFFVHVPLCRSYAI